MNGVYMFKIWFIFWDQLIENGNYIYEISYVDLRKLYSFI